MNFSLSSLRALPRQQLLDRLAALTPEERTYLFYKWEWWARQSQLEPDWSWTYWLIKAGRGFGKTRVGAEQVRKWVRRWPLVNLIGATVDDARDIMIEGESGILAICPESERPRYVKHERKLKWPNGAVSLIFTADEPERLRGKQHMKLWCDEMAAWRYPEAWDQAKFGLRLGHTPQAVVTTTPRPTAQVRELMNDPACHVTHGSTRENFENLASTFISIITKKYEGTRLGRQELEGEVLDDNPNALFKREDIEKARIPPQALPSLKRVVVGVDPSVTSKEDSDLAGIVCMGMTVHADGREHGYVLDDESLIATPRGWARKAVDLYHRRSADRLVAEVNNGGDMVEETIRAVDENISYEAVRASRGKAIRAEPISALYEQGRIHHVGCLAKLEDEMCSYDPLTSEKSPDRMDALVWAAAALFAHRSTAIIEYARQQLEERKRKENRPWLNR